MGLGRRFEVNDPEIVAFLHSMPEQVVFSRIGLEMGRFLHKYF